MGRILLGLVVGIVLAPLACLGWFRFGHVPVAVADKPLPYEHQLVHIPLEARIGREMTKTPPVQVDEGALLAGAHVYEEQCAVCHGFHGKPSRVGGRMFPVAPQLWEKHPGTNIVGVSDDPPGETQWKVANGIRLSGMPAYKSTLTATEIWQVSLLLSNADKPLPPSVINMMRGETSKATNP